MKKNLLKRIGAVALAVAVSLTMGVTSFAADSVNTDGTWNPTNGIETDANTINIAKQIVFVNKEATQVREPNIVYTYTISSANLGTTATTVTDSTGMPGTVKAGPLAAVTGTATNTTSTITFADTNELVSATSTGTAAQKYASFTFNPAQFKVGNTLTAGIYRYQIAETCGTTTKAEAGITQASGYNANRFLDVYVKWKDDAHTALEIYGYVLFEGEATTSITTQNISIKSKGYVNTAGENADPADVDIYETQNLYIEKTTTGAMADVSNDFPVTLNFTAKSGVTATPKIGVTLGGNGALTGATSDDNGAYITYAATMNGTVDNGSSIYLKGIPAGTSVTVVETNNTTDSYKVQAGTQTGGTDLLPVTTVGANGTATVATSQTLSGKVSVYITNTLAAISPTNVVMRYAPFIFIFAAAILLLVVMRRRRTHDAE